MGIGTAPGEAGPGRRLVWRKRRIGNDPKYPVGRHTLTAPGAGAAWGQLISTGFFGRVI